MFTWLTLLGAVFVGIVGLLAGGDMLVRGAARFARRLGVSAMVVGLTIVAIGTSMPELVVSVNAAIQGITDVTVGNAVGSNLFNLLCALGLISLVRPFHVEAGYLKREIPIMLGAMLATWAFCLGGSLPRPLAFLLLVALVGYLYVAVQLARRERDKAVNEKSSEIPVEAVSQWRNVLFMVVGFALMVIGSDIFLHGAVGIARALGVGELVIGLTLVAAGTSFPELFTCLIAVLRAEYDIALGNLVGSCIFNMLGILGCAGLLRPLPISNATLERDMPAMLLAGLLTWLFVWTGNRITRFEGGLLFAGYFAYLVYLTAMQTG